MSDCAVYPFPFGRLKIGYEGDAVTLLKRTDEPAGGEGRTPLTDLAFGQISEYLEGRRREFDFPYLLRGTEFQQKVWRALCAIPYGETRTYGNDDRTARPHHLPPSGTPGPPVPWAWPTMKIKF